MRAELRRVKRRAAGLSQRPAVTSTGFSHLNSPAITAKDVQAVKLIGTFRGWPLC